MSGVQEHSLMDALAIASAFAMFGKKRRMQEPEEEERLKKKAEEKFDADYRQALEDDLEFRRNPRAFLRRLSKLGGQKP